MSFILELKTLPLVGPASIFSTVYLGQIVAELYLEPPIRCDVVCAVLCCSVVWCGVLWYGVLWCGVLWFGVFMVCYGLSFIDSLEGVAITFFLEAIPRNLLKCPFFC